MGIRNQTVVGRLAPRPRYPGKQSEPLEDTKNVVGVTDTYWARSGASWLGTMQGKIRCGAGPGPNLFRMVCTFAFRIPSASRLLLSRRVSTSRLNPVASTVIDKRSSASFSVETTVARWAIMRANTRSGHLEIGHRVVILGLRDGWHQERNAAASPVSRSQLPCANAALSASFRPQPARKRRASPPSRYW
jgi:hypothetical protein